MERGRGSDGGGGIAPPFSGPDGHQCWQGVSSSSPAEQRVTRTHMSSHTIRHPHLAHETQVKRAARLREHPKVPRARLVARLGVWTCEHRQPKLEHNKVLCRAQHTLIPVACMCGECTRGIARAPPPALAPCLCPTLRSCAMPMPQPTLLRPVHRPQAPLPTTQQHAPVAGVIVQLGECRALWRKPAELAIPREEVAAVQRGTDVGKHGVKVVARHLLRLAARRGHTWRRRTAALGAAAAAGPHLLAFHDGWVRVHNATAPQPMHEQVRGAVHAELIVCRGKGRGGHCVSTHANTVHTRQHCGHSAGRRDGNSAAVGQRSNSAGMRDGGCAKEATPMSVMVRNGTP
eukprot:355151-Chlamydomonas_euryale.AAC.8